MQRDGNEGKGRTVGVADFKITMADTRPRRLNHPLLLTPKSRLAPSVRSLCRSICVYSASKRCSFLRVHTRTSESRCLYVEERCVARTQHAFRWPHVRVALCRRIPQQRNPCPAPLASTNEKGGRGWPPLPQTF